MKQDTVTVGNRGEGGRGGGEFVEANNLSQYYFFIPLNGKHFLRFGERQKGGWGVAVYIV